MTVPKTRSGQVRARATRLCRPSVRKGYAFPSVAKNIYRKAMPCGSGGGIASVVKVDATERHSHSALKGGRAAKTLAHVPTALQVALLLLTVHCSLLTALAQPGQPGPSSPLYGARPQSGMTSSGLPKALRDVSIEQKLNLQLPLDLNFRDENGETVMLGNYFGKKPVVLALVYYECPMLCTQVLNGMVSTFKVLSFKPGEEFEVVTVSFDPRETPKLAAAKKKTYVGYLPESKRAPAANGWHFLTGDQENIKRIADAVGFNYHFDEVTNQFAHASAIMVATPDGRLSHYFYGIEYSPKDLRLSLVEASQNKIGSPVDQLLLYCYHYDPATGKYGAVIMNMVRLGGIATLILMIVGFVLMRRRVRAASRARLRVPSLARDTRHLRPGGMI